MLKSCGFTNVTVSLVSNDTREYNEIMQPETKATLDDVCEFIMSCKESGEML